MELHAPLLSIGLLIVTAKLIEGIFKRFGLNSIIAYATAGVILGPVTGIVDTTPSVELMLSLGIFLFFFLIGLEELDIKGFFGAMRGRLFIASALSVIISLLVCLSVTTDFIFDLQLDLRPVDALALAGVLSLSSLGVVAKVLIEEGRLKEAVGLQVFTAVALAEVMVLFVVGFSISEHILEDHGKTLDVLTVLIIMGQIIAFTIVTWFVSTKVLPRVIMLLHRYLRVPQLSFGLLLGALLLVVVAAEAAGLHGTLGALLFGSALSMLPYQVRHDIMPGMRGAAEGLFVPLFFASAGLYLNLDFLNLPVVTILGLILVPLAGKYAGAFISAYVTRLDAPFAVASGLMAKGVAEIALLLLLLHITAISEAIFSLLVLVMIVYILLSPFGISFALRRAKHAGDITRPEGVHPSVYRFALEGVMVGDIVDNSRTYPDKSISAKEFVENWLVPEQHDYIVTDQDKLAGIVSLSMLRYLPQQEWGNTALGEVLRHTTPTAYSDEPVEDALQRMLENSLTALPVRDRDMDEFIGSVSSGEILEMLILNAQGREA